LRQSARLPAPEQGPEDAPDDVLAEPRAHDFAAGPDRRVDRLLALSRRSDGGLLLCAALTLGLARGPGVRGIDLLLPALHLPLELGREVLHKAQESARATSTYFDVVDAPDFTVAKLREWVAHHDSIYPPVDPAAAERWWTVNGARLAPRGSGIAE
jgi:hypothetical protein